MGLDALNDCDFQFAVERCAVDRVPFIQLLNNSAETKKF
jgi:hypothetical protein